MALFMWYLRKSSRFDPRAQVRVEHVQVFANDGNHTSNFDLKVLGLFLKAVVKKLKINDTKYGDLGSSMFITMLIHYLQQTNPPVLPGISEVCLT